MAREDLSLASGLIKKGEGRGLDPAVARQPEPAPVYATPEPTRAYAPEPAIVEDDPPLRPAPPEDVPKRFTSFRLPVSLDEDLRSMIFETRRTKQDLLIEFVTAGIEKWRRDRSKRG